MAWLLHSRPEPSVIARDVVHGQHTFAADEGWTQRIAAQVTEFRVDRLAGSDGPVVTKQAKADMHAATGAAAVDMESHIAARIAAKHGLPFAAVRVVADRADRALPPAAVAGFGPGGRVDIGAVLKALARQPAQLPQLIRVSVDTRAAFAALVRSFGRFGALPGALPRRKHLIIIENLRPDRVLTQLRRTEKRPDLERLGLVDGARVRQRLTG